MITVTFSELRNHARKYFDRVEAGETVEVYRNGKPVARLTPCRGGAGDRWKTANPLRIPGVVAGRYILEERRKSR